MSINYPQPVTARLDDAEREILKRIQDENSRPGLACSQSEAIKIALHDWDEHHPAGSNVVETQN